MSPLIPSWVFFQDSTFCRFWACLKLSKRTLKKLTRPNLLDPRFAREWKRGESEKKGEKKRKEKRRRSWFVNASRENLKRHGSSTNTKRRDKFTAAAVSGTFLFGLVLSRPGSRADEIVVAICTIRARFVSASSQTSGMYTRVRSIIKGKAW